MVSMKAISDLGELGGKTVLLRADLNVPMKNGEITDDGRIRAALKTLNILIKANARIVVISHLGRPGGKVSNEFSLAPVALRLQELLAHKVQFVDSTIGEQAEKARTELEPGDVLLLENLRFNEAETSKNTDTRLEFAKELAKGAHAFVSDGFGVVHRQQASVTEIPTLLPSVAGELVAEEISVLSRLTENPETPYVVILGGSKVSDKLKVIDNLLEKADTILIGGGMLFTFLAAKGIDIASSLCENDQIETVDSYLKKAERLGVKIILPRDVVVAEKFSEDAKHTVVDVENISKTAFGAKAMGLDIGPKTSAEFSEIIKTAKTVFWNGPMGVFEFDAFSKGTKGLAAALSETSAFTVVGGGDSAAAIRILGFNDNEFSHISTGGGASLEYLEGNVLPGIEVLQ